MASATRPGPFLRLEKVEVIAPSVYGPLALMENTDEIPGQLLPLGPICIAPKGNIRRRFGCRRLGSDGDYRTTAPVSAGCRRSGKKTVNQTEISERNTMIKNVALIIAGVVSSVSMASAQVELKSYADANGYIDVQKL